MKKMDDGLLKKFDKVETVHWWWEGRRELLKFLLRGSRPTKILDVGSGTGETLTFLKSLFPKSELYGVDTSTTAIKFAKRRGHKNIFKASALKLPFKNNFFDTVLFLDVLEHIKDDQSAINEAARVLRKGGKILITSPGLSFIWSAHDTEQGHKRRYTRTRIKQLADSAGLKLGFVSYFNFLLSFPIIVIRLLSNLKPFRGFVNYDNGINYKIADFDLVNSILKKVFVSEIEALRYIRYPIGISISAVLVKH